MSELQMQEIDGSIVISAKIVPGSSKTSIEGILDRMLKVKVAAPPEKGKANKELTSFIAKKLKIKRKDVQVISGLTCPVKQISIHNVSKNDIIKLLQE